jgi:hypothetical protein
MIWSAYVECFLAGVFLANAVPHFVQGISGDPFPTPFARPPGRGLSSPTLNVVWALGNLVVGYLLFRAGGVSTGENRPLVVFLVGVAVSSILMSQTFSNKQTRA